MEVIDVFGEVDAVVHNGADTLHPKLYTVLRAATIELTKESLDRKNRIQYTSTVEVCFFDNYKSFPVASVT
jgi:thioester reductase-like protein